MVIFVKTRAAMRINERRVLELMVEVGIRNGWQNAYAEVDAGEAPSPRQIQDSMNEHVMASLNEIIIFDDESDDLELGFPPELDEKEEGQQ